jgi:hypothetical protein
MHCMRRSSSSSRQHQQRHSRAGMSLCPCVSPCMEAGRQNDAEESESLAVPTAEACTPSMYVGVCVYMYIYIIYACSCTSAAAAACPCPARRRREIGRTRREEKPYGTLDHSLASGRHSTLLQCDLNVLSLPITFQVLSTRPYSQHSRHSTVAGAPPGRHWHWPTLIRSPCLSASLFRPCLVGQKEPKKIYTVPVTSNL